ncbi:MAG: carboxylating nicotinate-nucleotide diphosphorylase [Candidatus Riflebacteria bacterium]|nr:carboxylating nicotinate-nucleotide diphosphorylase [Candidatus Riflebacteria bacterium]
MQPRDLFAFPPRPITRRVIRAALEEDFPGGIDLASFGLFDARAAAQGIFQAKAEGVLAGGPLIERVYEELDGDLEVELLVDDGAPLMPRQVFAKARGPVRALLGAERTALNLLMRLSGIATSTRAYVRAIEGTGCRVTDTRKTTPGLRALEKYAVRAGGGTNHRMSLSDGALVKDNHLAACGDPARALAAMKARLPHTVKLEVEVTGLEQARMAADAGADILLLDNMTPEAMAVVARELAGKVVLEASGGITLDSIAAVARCGVQVISVGALTHSVKALDMSFELVVP